MRHSFCSVAVIVALSGSLATTGCTSTYIPRQGPRVSMVMQGGTIGFVRDGRLYRGGAFGGQLMQAVAGNEAALTHARTYRNLTAAGFATSMGGLAVVLIGDLLWVAASSGSGRTSATGLFAILGVGLSLDLVGLVMSLSAMPHMYDAINVYNDDLESHATPHPSSRAPLAPGMYIGPVETAPPPPPAPLQIAPTE